MPFQTLSSCPYVMTSLLVSPPCSWDKEKSVKLHRLGGQWINIKHCIQKENLVNRFGFKGTEETAEQALSLCWNAIGVNVFSCLKNMHSCECEEHTNYLHQCSYRNNTGQGRFCVWCGLMACCKHDWQLLWCGHLGSSWTVLISISRQLSLFFHHFVSTGE